MRIQDHALARRLRLKQTILDVFRISETPSVSMTVAGFSEGDWQRALWWLDVSGLALYFVDRARAVGADSGLPERTLAQLDLRLQRNRARTRLQLQQARTLAGWFDAASIEYAVLKGISLTPDSVPDSSLRWQADLDFLVSRKGLPLAVHYVSRLGYTLRADTGKTLEFISGSAGISDVAEIYCASSPKALELHMAEDPSEVLARRRTRSFNGVNLPTLSPADIFVQQALHLLKHLCGEHTRISWVLELRRHAEARQGDPSFWRQVETIAVRERNADLAIGVALWLAAEFFGPLTFELRDEWRAQRMPPRVQVWLHRYARKVLMSDAIASKYYALLRDEIPGRHEDTRSLRRILFPPFMPIRITKSPPRESLVEHAKRCVIEARHFFTRLRFHVFEGLRFAIEASRWRKAVARCER